MPLVHLCPPLPQKEKKSVLQLHGEESFLLCTLKITHPVSSRCEYGNKGEGSGLQDESFLNLDTSKRIIGYKFKLNGLSAFSCLKKNNSGDLNCAAQHFLAVRDDAGWQSVSFHVQKSQ